MDTGTHRTFGLLVGAAFDQPIDVGRLASLGSDTQLCVRFTVVVVVVVPVVVVVVVVVVRESQCMKVVKERAVTACTYSFSL